MEVDVIINGQLAKNAVLTNELHKNSVERRTLSKNKKYHVFFCYRDVPNDKRWVKKAVNKLENDYGYICCDHERDFVPGTKTTYNIKYAIKNSEKVVAVLSNEALDSGYLEFETEMAHREGIDNRENLLIPVLLDDCEIPAELKLLTYIDARKEINETTWWPKLVAAIESKGGYSFFKGRKEEETKHNSEDQPRFYFQQLCSLETTFSFKQCSVQSTSKYIPSQLASKDAVVSVETIKNIKRDLLDVPRIRWKQNCSCFVSGCLMCFSILWVLSFVIAFAVFISNVTSKDINTKCFFIIDSYNISTEKCYLVFGILAVIEISVGICCGVGTKYYYKEPRNLDKKIIEYNNELIKNGILITLVSQQFWKDVTKYVILQLREHRKIERANSNVSGIEEQHYVDDVPLLNGSGNEDFVVATEKYVTPHLRENRKLETETFVDTSELQAENDSEIVDLLAVNGNDGTAQITNTFHWRHDRNEETETFADTSKVQEKRIADDVPLLDISENGQLDQTTENEAMTLLLKYAHEYLRMAFMGKMSNPRKIDINMITHVFVSMLKRQIRISGKLWAKTKLSFQRMQV